MERSKTMTIPHASPGTGGTVKDFIWTASIKSAVAYHEDLAKRAEKRVESSKTPDSGYCRELAYLADLHREAAELFRKAAHPHRRAK
jgi:hypothetical protein